MREELEEGLGCYVQQDLELNMVGCGSHEQVNAKIPSVVLTTSAAQWHAWCLCWLLQAFRRFKDGDSLVPLSLCTGHATECCCHCGILCPWNCSLGGYNAVRLMPMPKCQRHTAASLCLCIVHCRPWCRSVNHCGGDCSTD